LISLIQKKQPVRLNETRGLLIVSPCCDVLACMPHRDTPGMTITERLAAVEGLLTAKQVAAMLSLHPVTIRKWISAGKIPHMRIGASVKFDPAALARWLEKRTLP
jgi:excisionase family DNA binding protein